MHKYLIVLLNIAAFVAVFSIGSASYADLGPQCTATNCDHIYPTGLPPESCREYCNSSTVCTFAGNDMPMGGFWGESFLNDPELKIYNYKVLNMVGDEKFPNGVNALEYCTVYCNEKLDECTTDECRVAFQPAVIDCSKVRKEDRAECESSCTGNILTSACGRDCLTKGVSETGVVKRGCEYLCMPMNDCYDEDNCATLPLNKTNHWSLLAVLMTLLALGTAGLIAFFNRKSAPRA